MNDIILFKKTGDKIQCLLCPNYCKLSEGQYGLCKTRLCKNDEIINPYSGVLSASSVDPIEKKPLYHFMPGSSVFSIGFYGCTLKCLFCQNYSISQEHPEKITERFSPQDILYLMKEKSFRSIAFTYSEPTLYFEWVLKTAMLCRKSGIKTVLVTNGYLNPEPAEILLSYIDAVNVDLKSMNEDFYLKICSGKLSPVKEFIRKAYNKKVHLELTTLVITDTNDSEDEMNLITDFIASISKEIPFHISRYHPEYRFNKPATSADKIESLVNLAKKKLIYVYGGNVITDSDTYCKNCKELLVQRSFYQTKIKSLDKNANCKKCGAANNIII